MQGSPIAVHRQNGGAPCLPWQQRGEFEHRIMVWSRGSHRWLVEADFTPGFEGTSLGQRPPKNSGKAKAALCAGLVPIPVWGAVHML
jgi:hypothetical protein